MWSLRPASPIASRSEYSTSASAVTRKVDPFRMAGEVGRGRRPNSIAGSAEPNQRVPRLPASGQNPRPDGRGEHPAVEHVRDIPRWIDSMRFSPRRSNVLPQLKKESPPVKIATTERAHEQRTQTSYP